ncbi:MAG TPA: hypothetical protein VMV10_13870 [Pirellulales bacterium]|nr:hypothetical protein [Pirellulales bacterium]
MQKIPLIHPIYLDVPMLVSFAAALQGGLALESEVVAERGKKQSTSGSVSGKLGLSQLFQKLFDASASTELAGERESATRESKKEAKAHTEASIAILLYHQLKQEGGYIVEPTNEDQLGNLGPGSLVEVAGTVEKNAVDAVIDCFHAAAILVGLDPSQPAPQHGKKRQPGMKAQFETWRDSLDSDRKRTPLSNIVVRCMSPANLSVVVTLRTEHQRDLTLSELHKNSVRVVGKVTRVIPEGASMISFENYGMAMLPRSLLTETFKQLTSAPDALVANFGDIEVHGPAIQILPLMVFV